ncbi:hypothetical protein P4I94_33380, partial [Bacillus cereus]|nr:hypothetical protein [Bacillus cereus]
TGRRAKALPNNGFTQSLPSAGFGFYLPLLRNRLNNIYYKEIYELCFPPLLTIQIYHVKNQNVSVNRSQIVRR